MSIRNRGVWHPLGGTIRRYQMRRPSMCDPSAPSSQREAFDALNGLPSLVPELIAEVDSLQVVVAGGPAREGDPSTLSSEVSKRLLNTDMMGTPCKTGPFYHTVRVS